MKQMEIFVLSFLVSNSVQAIETCKELTLDQKHDWICYTTQVDLLKKLQYCKKGPSPEDGDILSKCGGTLGQPEFNCYFGTRDITAVEKTQILKKLDSEYGARLKCGSIAKRSDMNPVSEVPSRLPAQK